METQITSVIELATPLKMTCTQCGIEHERKGIYCSKRCTDAAYRARKKALLMKSIEPVQEVAEINEIVEETKVKSSSKRKAKEIISLVLTSPVRLFHSLKMIKEKSYCAKAGNQLNFEKVNEEVFRIKKGKRIYYASSEEVNLIL